MFAARATLLVPRVVRGGGRMVRYQARGGWGLRRDCQANVPSEFQHCNHFTGRRRVSRGCQFNAFGGALIHRTDQEIDAQAAEIRGEHPLSCGPYPGERGLSECLARGCGNHLVGGDSRELRAAGIPRWKHEFVAMPQEIEQLKSDLQKASSAEQKESIEKKLAEAEAYFAELKNIQITLPTMTVDRRLILHRDSRTVEILWMGRAHTDGDLFVFLPNEKVLATGDALHGWTPTMPDSYPYDWIQTLDAAEKLDFEYVIGGR